MLDDVICETRTYEREFISHHHDYGQFLFPIKGTLDIQTKWQEVNLDDNHCFYLPPHVIHNYRSTDRNEFLILDIPNHLLPADTSSMYLPVDRHWAAIRYLLLDEARNTDNRSALIDLTRYVTSKLQVSNPPSIDYIHKHYKEPIRLETLSQIEHYHPVYYSAWFKKKTGKSPKVYIAELRLNEAKHLLLSTEWPISTISEELGFENSSSFTRWFVQSEGSPPQQFRMLKNG